MTFVMKRIRKEKLFQLRIRFLRRILPLPALIISFYFMDYYSNIILGIIQSLFVVVFVNLCSFFITENLTFKSERSQFLKRIQKDCKQINAVLKDIIHGINSKSHQDPACGIQSGENDNECHAKTNSDDILRNWDKLYLILQELHYFQKFFVEESEVYVLSHEYECLYNYFLRLYLKSYGYIKVEHGIKRYYYTQYPNVTLLLFVFKKTVFEAMDENSGELYITSPAGYRDISLSTKPLNTHNYIIPTERYCITEVSLIPMQQGESQTSKFYSRISKRKDKIILSCNVHENAFIRNIWKILRRDLLPLRPNN
ncbi:MAG: hypothetical protein Q4G68_06800 [Planctomycetia bacterium]|nr:hypothetical protein [Planctomycetia bacterium]